MPHEPMTADAFGAFYADHRAMLEGIAYRITTDRDLAQDVVANAVARVWQRVGADAPDQPLAYLVRAVQNEARDQLRRLGRARARDQFWASERPTTSTGTNVEDRDLLDRHLPSLPPAQRHALELRYLHDLPDAEIAARLGVQPVTVRSLAHRGLHRLRHRMAADIAADAAA